VLVHSKNFVKTCTVACGRVLSSSPLQVIGSRYLAAFGKNYSYHQNIKFTQVLKYLTYVRKMLGSNPDGKNNFSGRWFSCLNLETGEVG
jgi:hypothetical protein